MKIQNSTSSDYEVKIVLSPKNESVKELSEDDKKVVDELKKRDIHVRAHEHAHMAAGGAYIKGGATYEYQTGPDGKRYAVGGEVTIDTSAISGNPQATIQKMQIVKKAALAPSDPSGKDRSVAAAASQAEMKARKELSESKTESKDENNTQNEKTVGYNPDGKKTENSEIHNSLDISA